MLPRITSKMEYKWDDLAYDIAQHTNDTSFNHPTIEKILQLLTE